MNLFGTTATAGFVVSIICTVFFIALSLIYLNTKLKKDRARGLHFESRPKDVILAGEVELPSFFMSILPLIVVFGMFALLQVDILLALVIGIVVALIISRKYLKGNVMKTLMAGADGATTNMVGVAMIVAFAGAFKSTPNFQLVVDALLDLPFPPLVSAAIAVNVLCGITASAGGGLQVTYIAGMGYASPEDIDTAIVSTFSPRYAFEGPFGLVDFAGSELYKRLAELLFPEISDAKVPPQLIQDIIDSGKLGVRSGEGFYHYDHPETAGGKREVKITRMIQAINQVNEELGGYND